VAKHSRRRRLRAPTRRPPASGAGGPRRRSGRRAASLGAYWARTLRRKKNRPLVFGAAAFVIILAFVAAMLPDHWPRRMVVTAYCPCTECCGPNARGITASGRPVSANGGRFVAADTDLPFGTLLLIPGYNDGRPTEVLDRGGAIKGNRLDVYFPTHEEAKRWGVRRLEVGRVEAARR
jgi:3D (Asp-Asp-Asp) domain-containing protein